MLKTKHILPATLLILPMLSLPQSGTCDEIWVQSQTRLIAPSLPCCDNDIILLLSDDSNRPVPNASIEITISDEFHPPLHKIAQTNDNGIATLNADLSPGAYRASARYNGSDIYGQSALDFDFRFESCKQNAEFEFPKGSVFISHAPVQLRLKRRHCIDRSADWTLALGDDSKRIQLKPGQISTDISFPNQHFSDGSIALSADAIHSKSIEDESINGDIFILNTPPEQNCEFYTMSPDILARCQIPPSLRAWLKSHDAGCALFYRFLPSQSAIPNATQSPYQWINFFIHGNTSNKKSIANDDFEFLITNPSSGQLIYALRCPETNRDALAAGHAAFPNWNKTRKLHDIIRACAIALLLLAISVAVRKSFAPQKSKIPAPKSAARPKPDPVTHDLPPQKPAIHHIIPTKRTCTVSCFLSEPLRLDGVSIPSSSSDQTPAPAGPSPIPVGALTIEGDFAPSGDKSFFDVICGKPLIIRHKDALPWKGTIRQTGRVKIVLTTRRQYICECFCTVANHLMNAGDISWGKITPQRLLREFNAKQNANPARYKKTSADLETFCKTVSSATYGCTPISPELVESVYRMSKRIISKNA